MSATLRSVSLVACILRNNPGLLKLPWRSKEALPSTVSAEDKPSLFNRFTGADVLADAKMFATLDPTVRHLTLPSHRRVLLSDTVGFIRNLPTTLVKEFRPLP